MKLGKEQEVLEAKKKAAVLKETADKVGNQARRQDFLAKQLNRHADPPMLVLEVTTATGATERLHIWEDDDLDALGTAYAKANNLSEAGRAELIKVLKNNVESIRRSNGDDSEDDSFYERFEDRSGRNQEDEQDEQDDDHDDEGQLYEDDYEEEDIDSEIVKEDEDDVGEDDGKLRIDELL